MKQRPFEWHQRRDEVPNVEVDAYNLCFQWPASDETAAQWQERTGSIRCERAR